MKKFSFSGSCIAEVAEVAEVHSISQKQPTEVVQKSSEVTLNKEKKQITSEHFRWTSETANPGIIMTSATSATSEGVKVKNVVFDTPKVFAELIEVEKEEIITELIPNLKSCTICNGLNFVHGYRGGYYCRVCQYGIEGTPVKAGGNRQEDDIKGDDLDWHIPEDDHCFLVKKKRKKLPLPFMTAHQWFVEYKQELRTAGWTPVHLYRRNGTKGIAWLRIWENHGLEVSINGDGLIIFRFRNATGLLITQVAFHGGRENDDYNS